MKRSILIYSDITDKISEVAFLNDDHFVTAVRDKALQMHNIRGAECVFEYQTGKLYLQDILYSQSFSVLSCAQVGESIWHLYNVNIFYLDDSNPFKISVQHILRFNDKPRFVGTMHFDTPEYYVSLRCSTEATFR